MAYAGIYVWLRKFPFPFQTGWCCSSLGLYIERFVAITLELSFYHVVHRSRANSYHNLLFTIKTSHALLAIQTSIEPPLNNLSQPQTLVQPAPSLPISHPPSTSYKHTNLPVFCPLLISPNPISSLPTSTEAAHTAAADPTPAAYKRQDIVEERNRVHLSQRVMRLRSPGLQAWGS